MLKKKLTRNVYDCSAEDLLNVVADVKSYEDFIPFCSYVNIFNRSLSKGKECFSACLSVNFKFTTDKFLTNVLVNRERSTISISGDSNPFKSLIAEWSFIEKENFCKVTFSLEVSFTSFIKERLVSITFEKAASAILDAFEKRAAE